MILVNVQGKRADMLGAFARFVPLSMPFGIGSIAAFALARGHRVAIWDEGISELTGAAIRTLAREAERPCIFGLSCLTASIARGYALARQIKNLVPGAVVVMGGIHPTVCPDEVLAREEVDFVVRQEGEVPFALLCRALQQGSEYRHIPGLSYKDAGSLRHNPPAPGLDISLLPQFPFQLFAANRAAYDFGQIVSARGCPHNCIFCSQRNITGGKFSARTPEQIAADIDLLLNRYDQKLITFNDDNFLVDPARVKQLCALIVQRGWQRRAAFQCNLRGDDVNAEVLRCMREAHFITLNFGLETASEEVMRLIKKGETVARIEEALRLAKGYGFQLSGTYIFGLPGETGGDRRRAYQQARRYLDYVKFNNATPYPGTQLYEIARQEGRLHIADDWSNLNACGTLIGGAGQHQRLAYVPAGTDERELKTDILKYNLFFSLRPGVIHNLLRAEKGAIGWFRLPPRWYCRAEVWFVLRLAVRSACSLLRVMWLMLAVRGHRWARQLTNASYCR